MTSIRAVLGTAGHVDHGKTTLIRALTGTDTDRLPEEKARGISIALGFAHLDVPRGRIAFIDVPGHERFLRQMIAGAGGMGGVLFVIAADEGIMPQTREHLAVCGLLGLRHALIVLTKTDLVDSAWRELVQDDIRQTFAATPFHAAPIIPFAASEGATPDLLAALAALADRVHADRPDLRDRPFALPIDRVFTVRGFGTVVTGTTLGGTLATQAEVMWLPASQTARVRGLERFGAQAETVSPGERAAINLQGIAPDAVAPGDLLTTPGALVAARTLDVTLRAAPGVTLGAKTAAILHIGTTAVEATIARLDRRPPSAASDAAPHPAAAPAEFPAQLHLADPVGVFPGAPIVLRGFTRRPESGTIIAGGTAWAPAVRRANARTAPAIAATIMAHARRDPPQALGGYLAQHGEAGLARPALCAGLPFDRAAISQALESAIARGAVLATADRLYAADALNPLEAALHAVLEAFHKTSPTDAGLRPEELHTRARPSADPALVAQLITRAIAQKRWAQDGSGLVRLASHTHASADADPIARALEALLVAADLAPPRPDELAGALAGVAPYATKAQIDSAIRQLVSADRVVRVTPELVVARAALRAFEARVRAHFEAHETLDAQGLKALTGASRKFAIPLGEWLDRARITYRTGDVRRLRGR